MNCSLLKEYTMNIYWSEAVKRLDPYVPGEQPKDKRYIKLNTNENPYGPSPKVLEAVREATTESLRLYPDPECDMLLTAAAEYYAIKKDQIYAGNGSDEILAFSFAAFFDPGRTILFPDITYTFYPVYTALFNLDYRLVPLSEDLSLPVEDFFESPGGVVIANPNAPTGKSVPLDTIKRIIENNQSRVVIVDEAYIDFGGESAVRLIDDYSNLLVIHTLSKSRSLAGMRLGFAIGNSELIEAVKHVKNSFNSYTLDRLAIVAGTEAFRDNAYFMKTRGMIISTREKVTAELGKLGFTVYDSSANFVFVSHPVVNAFKIFTELEARGFLVRYFSKPRIDNCLRISIGLGEDMDQLLEAIREIVYVEIV